MRAAGARCFWPPRRPLRLNGAALRASPGSAPAGAAKNPSRLDSGQLKGSQVGQIRRSKWAMPDDRTQELLGNRLGSPISPISAMHK